MNETGIKLARNGAGAAHQQANPLDFQRVTFPTVNTSGPASPNVPARALRSGELAIVYEQRKVTVVGRPLKLTPVQYKVLPVHSVQVDCALTYGSPLRHTRRRPDREVDDLNLAHAAMNRLRCKRGGDLARTA